MPTYSKPQSDRNRLKFLKRAAATGAQNIASGNPYVSQETIDAINAFLPTFETAVNALGETASARSKAISERAAAIERVSHYARDMCVTLRRRAKRLGQPAEALAFYQLPLGGKLVQPNTQEQWLNLAAQLIEGDARAVAAGYPPVESPSAAELEALMETARSRSEAAAVAVQAHNAIRPLRPQADELIAEVMAELRFRLRKKDAPSRRDIMRAYGATFKYRKGESPAPDDAGDAASAEAEAQQ